MRQEFRIALGKAVTVAPADVEPEPSTSMSTEPCDTFPPTLLWTHHQHAVDYVRLMMEEDDYLTLGEN